MKISAVSDIHGELPHIPSGDLLIVAGDLTATDKVSQYHVFFMWLDGLKFKKKIYIGGNHDRFLAQCANSRDCADIIYSPECEKQEYLWDSGTEYNGVKIWGMPWNIAFSGQNPLAAAFSINEEEMAEKCALIPDDTQILVTHSPPYGILDGSRNINRFGSRSLMKRIMELPKLRYHFFGHIHEGYGYNKVMRGDRSMHFFNCSHLDRYYEAMNKPHTMRIDNETLDLLQRNGVKI